MIRSSMRGDALFLVHEIFASVQGEGIRTGLPTVFIRLAGCNLECLWCDTEFARSEKDARSLSLDEIIDSVRTHGMENICITGGEPFCHEGLSDLVASLFEEGFNVDLETNGSFDVGGLLRTCPGVFLSMDVKTPSSGMGGSFSMENLGYLRPFDQLKFIIAGKNDLDFAFDFINENRPECSIILTPCDNEGALEIVDKLKDELSKTFKAEDRDRRDRLSKVRMMLQMHKTIWGNSRGV